MCYNGYKNIPNFDSSVNPSVNIKVDEDDDIFSSPSKSIQVTLNDD